MKGKMAPDAIGRTTLLNPEAASQTIGMTPWNPRRHFQPGSDSGEKPGLGEGKKGAPPIKSQMNDKNDFSDNTVAGDQSPGITPLPMTPEEIFPKDSASPDEVFSAEMKVQPGSQKVLKRNWEACSTWST